MYNNKSGDEIEEKDSIFDSCRFAYGFDFCLFRTERRAVLGHKHEIYTVVS